MGPHTKRLEVQHTSHQRTFLTHDDDIMYKTCSVALCDMEKLLKG
jgi:hypothetical protein